MYVVLLYIFRPRKQKGDIVPVEFVAFLRVSLSKMAGHHFIHPGLIDLEFWSKMHLKFGAVKYYDKSLVIKIADLFVIYKIHIEIIKICFEYSG